jgi:hypothetical protein
MKSRQQNALASVRDKFFDTLAHLSGSLVGKGEAQNAKMSVGCLLHYAGNAKGENTRLAGAGAGKNKERSILPADGLELILVKRR